MEMEYRHNELCWHGSNLTELTLRYGSPLHVCSMEALQESCEEFLRPFRERQIPIACHFSLKTHPLPGLIARLRALNIGVEVINAHELWLAKRLGFTGDQIIVNGPGKSAELFRQAAAADVKMLSIESATEFVHLDAIVNKSNLALDGGREKHEFGMGTGTNQLNVALRICPAIPSGRFNFALKSAGKLAPYGFLADSRALQAALEKIKIADHLRFTGFHMHLGSGIDSPKPYARALSILEEIILAAARSGLQTRYVDIGGGFGSEQAPILSLCRIAGTFFLGKSPAFSPRGGNNLIAAVAEETGRFLARIERAGCPIEEILVEPGRRLAGPVQITLITVLDIIRRGDDRRILICDGGAMSLSPMLLIEHHRIVPLFSRGEARYPYTIMGHLPSALDRVVSTIMLPEIRIGDQLAILDTGAYFLPFENNFAGPRPAVYMIDGARSGLIRRRESSEDLLRCDFPGTTFSQE